jgi:hypothetical protein
LHNTEKIHLNINIRWFLFQLGLYSCFFFTTAAMLSRNQGGVSSPKDLDIEHYSAFERALRRTLETDVAEQIYAEVLDGLPLKASYLDFQFPQDGHPALEHEELSEGV